MLAYRQKSIKIIKDKLWLHLSNAMRKFQNDYNFIPTTYLMQYDYERLKIRIQEAKKKEIFIMKPVASGKLLTYSLWERN